MPVNMRRAGSVVLVQWAVGGSMGDAAKYLGIRIARSSGQHSFAPDLARWLGEHGEEGFTSALHDLAARLDADAPMLVNYHRRRQAMQGWCLDPDTWQDIADRLPPTPGPFRPIMDDRKRQEASAFTWAHVTQGEPRFAPRPIEASQPEPVRKDWKLAVTWGLYCQVYRLARSAMMLADHGMDQEGLVLVRVMLEHTIMLHWIVERGDDGIDAMQANQSKQVKRTFDRARGTAMEVPEAIAGEITASFDGVDVTKAVGNFSDICGEVGCGDLYWGLRDPEPVGPPVNVHEQRLHRSGVRCPSAHAAPRAAATLDRSLMRR